MSSAIPRMRDPAPILHHTKTEICFRVDEVERCSERLPLVNARLQFEKRLSRPLLAFAHDEASDVVSESARIEHGLVHAVYLAFSQHRPLVLTPDVIWVTLAQGFAHHVNNHAQALRSRIVPHKGKVTLDAITWELSSPEDWAAVIQQWSMGIQEHIPAELSELMLCNFTTTTPIIRTASQVVMMDAFQQYFDYHVYCICGIPTITVRGSVEDWVAIRKRVDVMAGYHLDWWTDRLKPICDGFIDTVQGHPSQWFWKHIYSPKEIYGGELITGWLADLFPYIEDGVTNAPIVRNPILAIPREQLTSEQGLSPKSVPTGLSRAPFTLHLGVDGSSRGMELIAGFVGVKQDVTTGRLEPGIGWAVLEEDEYSQLLRTLHAAGSPLDVSHDTVPWHQGENSEDVAFMFMTIPKEWSQLVGRFDHGCLFFAQTPHGWSLKTVRDLRLRNVTSNKFPSFSSTVHFMDLVDGRAIAYGEFALNKVAREWWIVVGKPEGTGFQKGSVMVIAESFLQFLQRIINAEGRYYFDEPDFTPDVVL